MEISFYLTGRSRPVNKIYASTALNSLYVRVSGCSRYSIAEGQSRSRACLISFKYIFTILKCGLFVLINRSWVRGRFSKYGAALLASILNQAKLATQPSAPC